MPQKHGPGCNCCEVNCALCSDTFTRSDTTDDATSLGACLEAFGTPGLEIVSNKLRITGNNAGVLFNNTGTFVSARIDVDLPAGSSGNVIEQRCIYGYQDASNYHCWEVRAAYTSSWAYRLKLIEVSGGVETTLEDQFFRAGTAGGIFNRFDFPSSQMTWFYDSATGWAVFNNPNANSTGGQQNASYKHNSALAGNRWGFGCAVNDIHVDLDEAKLWRPDQNTVDCPDILIHTRCNPRLSMPADEVNIDLALLGNATCDASSLNGTYVLTRIDDPNPPAYRNTGTLTDKGGIYYRYTLPSAICNVKYIDFWIAYNRSPVEQPWVYLVNASEAWLLRYDFSSFGNNCGTFDTSSISRTSNSSPSPNFGFISSTARVYAP
jgi:hypothetical protein